MSEKKHALDVTIDNGQYRVIQCADAARAEVLRRRREIREFGNRPNGFVYDEMWAENVLGGES